MAQAGHQPSEEVPAEPQGMEEEAWLLTSLQEVPNISKCWLRPAHAGGLSLTVRSPGWLIMPAPLNISVPVEMMKYVEQLFCVHATCDTLVAKAGLAFHACVQKCKYKHHVQMLLSLLDTGTIQPAQPA